MSQLRKSGDNSFRSAPFDIYFEDVPVDRELAQTLAKALHAALAGEAVSCSVVTVILTGDEPLRNLNDGFLGEPSPTDVLAFDLGAPGGELEGEIYISLDRARIQADQMMESLQSEVARLAIHGFLHLCGHDHNDDVSLELMMVRGEKYIPENLHRKAVGR